MKKIRIKWYVALKNHIFRFYDQAAGDIAALFMVWWDKTSKQKVVEELKLYSRYVDDEHIVYEALPENETNASQQRDEWKMKRLQEIGNSIHPSIPSTGVISDTRGVNSDSRPIFHHFISFS